MSADNERARPAANEITTSNEPVAFIQGPCIGLALRALPESRSDMDETDLATELEKSCFLEPELEGTYRRRYVDAPHDAVGLSWTGILEFFLKSKAQIVALCKAVLRAFAGRSVKVQIRSGDKELEVVARNTSLVELRQTVEALCESIENAE